MKTETGLGFQVVVRCALGVAFAIGAFQTIQPSFAGGGGTCATKHCNANTHCCYGCTANPICVRNGAFHVPSARRSRRS